MILIKIKSSKYKKNGVSFARGLLFAQFQRETIQNEKVVRSLPPWGSGNICGAPVAINPVLQTQKYIFSGAKMISFTPIQKENQKPQLKPIILIPNEPPTSTQILYSNPTPKTPPLNFEISWLGVMIALLIFFLSN